MLTLHRGHFGICPHSSHWSAGAHALLERRIITWPPSARAVLMCSISLIEKFPRIPRVFLSAVVSIISISESSVPWYLSVSSTSTCLPQAQLYCSSREGVAEPDMIPHLWIADIIRAVSRPLYLGAGESCLYELSCSSSTIMSPRSWWGRNTEERVPRTTYPLPLRTASAVLLLLAAVSAEWNTSSLSPKCS